MYYFNLFCFFPQIKHFQLNKIFSINALAANVSVIEGDYLDIFSNLLLEENYIYNNFVLRTKKFKNFFLSKKLSSTPLYTIINSQNLIISLSLYFVVLFFFFKNFLIFNAEKLMLIYFLLVILVIFFFSKKILKNLLDQDLHKLLVIAVNIEIEGEKILEVIKNSYKKLKINLAQTCLEFLILKNLELKLLNKIK